MCTQIGKILLLDSFEEPITRQRCASSMFLLNVPAQMCRSVLCESCEHSDELFSGLGAYLDG